MNRINIITLGTKDIVRAHEFYKKLGFATAVRGPESSPHIIFFKNEGTKIALYPLEDLSKDIDSANPPTVANGFTGFTLAYNAKTKEEVDELMKKAHVAGATIQKQPKQPIGVVTVATLLTLTAIFGRLPTQIPGSLMKIIC